MVFPRTTVAPGTYPAWRLAVAAMRGTAFVGVDLRPDDAFLAALPGARDPAEACVYLGCRLGPELAAQAADTGALVFPRIPGVDVDPFRTELYTPEELYRGFDPDAPGGYRDAFDARVYRGYMRTGADGRPLAPPQRFPVGVEVALARRLHDGAISDALTAFLAPWASPGGAGVVAIMGGHDVPRDHPEFRRVVEGARALARAGLLVATGGGPGLMEAGNLGAWLAPFDDAALDDAVARLAAAPTYRDPGWVAAAWRVRAEAPQRGGDGLGVPTWFYGHEPPNVFANHIAKYFENSLREEGLLAIASQGVIFAPGRAGTVQEIFQDACQNFYAVYGVRSPMVLLGSEYWSGPPGYPARALLEGLARDGGFADRVHVVDEIDDAVAIVRAFRPS